VRYSFLVRLSHPLLHAGLSRRILDHPVRPRQQVGRNRLLILDFRFWILDCSINGLLYPLWLEHSAESSNRSVWLLSD